MKLWILTQDKERLVVCDNYIGYFYDDEEDKHSISTYMFELGVYESKERALEIVADIKRFIIDMMNIEYMSKDDVPFGMYRPNIYEMPEK